MLTCCTGIRSRSNNAVPPPTPPHHAVSAGGGVALCPQRDDFRLRADQGAFGGVGDLVIGYDDLGIKLGTHLSGLFAFAAGLAVDSFICDRDRVFGFIGVASDRRTTRA